MKRLALAAAAVTAMTCAAIATAAPPTITESFDTGDDGWEIYEGPSTYDSTWTAGGGNPGGFIRYSDAEAASGQALFADGDYVTDISEYAGYPIVADLRTNAQLDVGPTVFLGDPDDYTAPKIHLVRARTLGTEWSRYEFPLSSNGSHRWKDANGDPVSQSEFSAFLDTDPAIFFRADYSSGFGETTDLDNVGIVTDVPTKITLKHREGTSKFSGKVKSDAKACVKKVTVRLFRRKGMDVTKVAKTKTDSSGKYSITEKPDGGKYFTRVEMATPEPGTTCLASGSKERKG